MAESDFESMLDVKLDDIQRPKPLPAGTYNFGVTDYEYVSSPQKGTPGVRFDLTFQEAGDDVPEDLLEQIPNYQQKVVSESFWLTENALWRLKNFLQAAGVETSGRSLKEAIPEAVGSEVAAQLTVQKPQGADEDHPGFNNIRSFAEAE